MAPYVVTTTEYQAQLPLYSAQDDDDFDVLLYILGGMEFIITIYKVWLGFISLGNPRWLPF